MDCLYTADPTEKATGDERQGRFGHIAVAGNIVQDIVALVGSAVVPSSKAVGDKPVA